MYVYGTRQKFSFSYGQHAEVFWTEVYVIKTCAKNIGRKGLLQKEHLNSH
jgi:hypothetical protein